jgi:hypothetical protein
MKTLGICIGIGDPWAKAAAYACAAMRLHTGVECVLCDKIPQLPEGWNPSWGKAFLWDMVPQDVERLLVFDADIVAIRPWSLPAPDDKFHAVREIYCDPTRRNELRAFGLRQYFNGGLFICPRSLAPKLNSVREYGPCYGTWLEQTALNVVMAEVFRPLPAQLNWILEDNTSGLRGAMNVGAVNVHLAGIKDPAQLVKNMTDITRKTL